MILVTGGTGLVGSHLITELVTQGKPVKALYRSAIPEVTGQQNIEWVQGDILDVMALEDAMQGVTEVYHCAAIVSFHKSEKGQMFKTNVEGTANVVNACLDAGVKKLCFVSSVAALGRIRKNQEVNETMNWSQETSNSNYGKSKYYAEMEVWRGIAEGLPAVIVNPVIILGSGDWNSGSSGIFKSAYNEFPWYTEGVSGFVDVKDVVAAMIQLTKLDVSGERFILSAGNYSYRHIFTTIAKSFSKKSPHKNVTPFIASVVWRLEAVKALFTGKKPLLTKETAHTAQASVHFNNTKITKFLPAFQFTPIEKTIERICKEMKESFL
ncbi:MAG: dihydroflavonol-4-reductase [Segetibacter sp.]|nr:dihydroflavonol-4-reductase [Segetibacter sp.]